MLTRAALPPALLSALLLLWACSSGGVTLDGGGEAPDLAAPAGDGPAADGPAPDLLRPDPAACPVGPADGCCPLLRHGGHDPDCPSLACGKLAQSPPIALDVGPVDSDSGGQVAMDWSGRELALAWIDFRRNAMTGDTRVVFERRDLDGQLRHGPVESTPPGVVQITHGVTALAYEPRARRYVMGVTPYMQKISAVGLDADGKALWTRDLAGICNKLDSFVDVYTSGDRAVVVQQGMTCAGSTYWPQLDLLDLAGAPQGSWRLGDGMRANITLAGMFAYDPDQARVLSIYVRNYENTLNGRFVDLRGGGPQPSFELLPQNITQTYERLGLSFDGQRYGVLVEQRLSYSSYAQRFRLWDPKMGWLGEWASLGGPRAILPPGVIWTGDGFLVAAMTYDGPNEPLSEHGKFTSVIWSLSPDGALRETIAVDAAPAIYPKLTWAGGKVALTWVRVEAGRYSHWLRYLSCP